MFSNDEKISCKIPNFVTLLPNFVSMLITSLCLFLKNTFISLARQCAQLWLKTRESLGYPLGVISETGSLVCPKELVEAAVKKVSFGFTLPRKKYKNLVELKFSEILRLHHFRCLGLCQFVIHMNIS